ncbi:hypothetical protein FISHEDRAFT_46165 [Fistulina hepatica ATCC 64428]|uniref:Peroxisomal membrane protein PEX14 n=1 Tax=Fistulina hepatica ATCC 64428 TaxID=1128425 RepID=A0A0D7A892_9AGAR|nr:hypothetical protein FISHEDRAFT_46165 [Fistulina hepatica ATCC 64428]
MAERAEFVQNAVQFLLDPQTLASPLAQRIKFLEAKGLTPAEIDDAIRQANHSAPSPSQTNPYASYGPAYGPLPYTVSQPWDWRDYFITVVVSGSLAYGAVSLFKKYLLPHLRPPESTVYEADRDALTAQFDAAEALLKEIQAETAGVRAAVEEQQAKVDQTTRDVDAAVKSMHEQETRIQDEMREVREEVNTIRDMLPKMIEKNKESQTQSLGDLQQELRSLKALLLSRGSLGPSPSAMNGVSSPPGGTTAGSPLNAPVPRPSIPAWQLSTSASSSAPYTSSVPTAPPSSLSTVEGPAQPAGPTTISMSPPLVDSKGKGKQVDQESS